MKFFETLSGNTPLIRIDYRLDGRPEIGRAHV